MKKRIVLWLAACLLASTSGFAQVTTGGNFVIGSTLGFSNADSKITVNDGAGDKSEANPTSTQFNLAPSIGYFVIDNLALGIRMDYTFARVVEDEPLLDGSERKTRDSDLLFGPFGRYYWPIADDMAFFFEAGFGFGNSSDIQNIAGERQSINTNIFAVGIGPGFTVISSSAVGIEALLKYNYARSDFDTQVAGVRNETVTRTNQFDFSIGVQFYFSAIRPATRTEAPERF